MLTVFPMRVRVTLFLSLVCAGLLVAASRLQAAVTRIEISERSPVLEGAVFGQAGAYERIVGRVHFALDPAGAANAAIRDLSLAETDVAGRVTFSATFFVLKPVDPTKGNGTSLLEVSNRGGKALLTRFCLAERHDDPRAKPHFGDAWLLEQGYTLAWVGWQWDVPDGVPLRVQPARLRDAGAPGLVRAEFIPDEPSTRMPLGDRSHRPIPLAEPLRLGVRSHPDEASRDLPATTWRVTEDGEAVVLEGGFKPGLLYEFVYRGKSPVVSGLGLAAIRDFVSFAKHGGAVAEPLGQPQRAIAFGISQSGRLLRHFLFEGFNADEEGRMVFDGVWADVAGAGRGSFNHRYAQASRDGNPWTNVFYPTDLFPFHDEETHDGVAGQRGALLGAARAARVVPKIFYTNNSYEYWGRAAALVHMAPDGRADVSLAPLTRVYHLAGAQHGPGTIPALPRASRYAALPVDHRPVQRALLDALRRWVSQDIEPPPSVYPRIADGTLVSLDALQLPALAGFNAPAFPRLARRLDFGAEFERTGVMLAEKVVSRGAFPLRVPAFDADGIPLGGIRLPLVAVPLGSYLPWNFRAEPTGGPGHMANFVGSFLPFAKTEQARRIDGDPRPAIHERYRGRDEYLARVGAAADELIAARFLLARDRGFVLGQAAQLWESVMK